MSDDARASLFPFLALTEIPAIGSSEREAHEEAALALGRELLVLEEGRITDALFDLENEIRGYGEEHETRLAVDLAREYSRKLVRHVEQCWTTAVLR